MIRMQGAAILTLLTAALQIWAAVQVAKARGRFGIKAPATTGDPGFERVFRAQMNTIENTLVFLPVLWISAFYGLPVLYLVAGAIWLLARVWYVQAYSAEAARRGLAFTISMAALGVLLADAGLGIARSMAG